jgi:hypothetical protein
MRSKLFMVLGTPESGWLINSGPIYSIGINHLINTPNNLLNLSYNMSIRFFATSIKMPRDVDSHYALIHCWWLSFGVTSKVGFHELNN